MGSSTRRQRTKKRKYYGGKNVGEEPSEKISKKSEQKFVKTSKSSASGSKLDPSKVINFDKNADLSGYRFMDVLLFQSFVEQFSCPNCSDKAFGTKMKETRIGQCSTFVFICPSCEHSVEYCTSEKIHPNGTLYDVNRRLTLSMFAIGRNRAQAGRFLANMSMPPPQSMAIWNRHKKRIHQATKKVAQVSMNCAVQEARQLVAPHASNTDIVDMTISVDGTWQKRGFSSKNGTVTALSVAGVDSKVVDIHTMANYCNACANMKGKKPEEEFRAWQIPHIANLECEKNHDGSSGAMEPAGAKTIFMRSLPEQCTQYTGYLGDGDSKSYHAIAACDPPIYPGDVQIKKLECNGHIQKRMGKRLMDLVTKNKDKTFDIENGRTTKGIGGANKLTKKAILRIQGHYGAAIRNNAGNVNAMYDAIWAIFNHRNRDHRACGDWCPSVSGIGNADANSLPGYVCEKMRPVFEALSARDLLEKCSHGGTQNTNESYHNMIWERCPKTQFVGRNRLEIAVYDAAIAYNGGELARIPVFEALNISPGYWTVYGLARIDKKRVDNAYVAGVNAVIEQRRDRALNRYNLRDIRVYQAGMG